MLRERRPALQREFNKIGVDGVEAGMQLTSTLEKLMDDFFGRNVTKVTPQPPNPCRNPPHDDALPPLAPLARVRSSRTST